MHFMEPSDFSQRKFAIIIPCYKSEHTIAATLRGIMEQGEALDRVLCVVIADDVSPDQTVEVAKAVWQLQHPPLRFEQRRKNLGEMINVNTAVAGLPPQVEWWLNMHGDNIPKPDWLKLITDRCLATPPNVGIVCASYDSFYEDGRTQLGDEQAEAPLGLIKGEVANVRCTIRQGCWWHNSCGAIRVVTFREVGGLPPGMRQKGDWDFLLRVLHAGWDIEYLPRTLMRYRIHGAGASGFAFQFHFDVEETLQVIQKYSRVLTWGDIICVHRSNAQYLVRRTARSLLHRDFVRARKAVRMLVRVGASCVSCLAAR